MITGMLAYSGIFLRYMKNVSPVIMSISMSRIIRSGVVSSIFSIAS